jgi:hypothetical protein
MKFIGRKMFVSTRFYRNIFRFGKYLASYRRDVQKFALDFTLYLYDFKRD